MVGGRGDWVFDEPHLRGGNFAPDPSERAAAEALGGKSGWRDPAGEQAARSVWDEPATSPVLAGEAPGDAVRYSAWLGERISATSVMASWAATLAIAALAGPLSILGSFLGMMMQGAGFYGQIIGAVFFAPLIEETMKAGVILYVIEKWPYLFRSRVQILMCAAASALVFAGVENVLYLRVYYPDHEPAMAAWRWTVCVALHLGCTMIVAMGLMRMWREVVSRLRPAELATAGPYFVAGAAVHAAYNASAIVMEMTRV